MVDLTEEQGKARKNITKAEKEIFLAHSNEVYIELKTKTQLDDLQKPLLITKNDSIEKKVESIINNIDENKSILIINFPGAVAKTVAIIEIAKQKRSSKINIKQFNHLSSQVSLSDTYNKTKDTQNKSQKQLSIELGIRDPRTHTMPIISIFLTSNENITSIDGWTLQEI